MNYNNDQYTDLMLYGSTDEKVTVHRGSENNFDTGVNKFFYYAISDIEKLNSIYGTGDNFIFVSRSERIGGLVSFTKYGSMTLLNTMEFSSYPSNISTADVNLDGNLEALISGNNFNGLSLISQNNFVLTEKKLFPNRIFSDAKFLDMDYDEYPDIAALDVLNNSITFFSNNRLGGFREERKIELNFSVDNFTVSDFYADGFVDILFPVDNGIEILLGDSVSTFNVSKIINLGFKPKKFLINDFNNDGLNDFCLLNDQSDEVSIAFADDSAGFYETIPYSYKGNTNDIIDFDSSNQKKIGILSDNGQLQIVSRLEKINSGFSISVGRKPNLVGVISKKNSIAPLVYFTDDSKPSLNVLESTDSIYFKYFYTTNLSNHFTDLIWQKSRKPGINFYNYSIGERLIELISLEFNKNFDYKSEFYTDTKLSSLTAVKHAKYDTPELRMLLNTGDTLSYSKIENNKFNTINKLDTNYITGIIKPGKIDSVYYWTKTDSSLLLKLTTSKNNFNQNVLLINLPNDSSYNNLFFIKPGNLNSNKASCYTFVALENDTLIYLLKEGTATKLNLTDAKINIAPSRNSIFINENEESGSDYFYFVLNNKLNAYNLEKGNFQLKQINSIDSLYIKNYFVTKLFLNKSYIVYSDSIKHCISFLYIE